MTTPSVTQPTHAILSTEEVQRVVMALTGSPQQTLEAAAAITGLPAEIVRHLVRNGIIAGAAPYRVVGLVGWCDIDAARRIAAQLAAARRAVAGRGIGVRDAEQRYNFSNPSLYRWRDEGWLAVLPGEGDTLFDEGDVAFARALADMVGHAPGKPVFPPKRRSK
jgi:hypothetical protein